MPMLGLLHSAAHTLALAHTAGRAPAIGGRCTRSSARPSIRASAASGASESTRTSAPMPASCRATRALGARRMSERWSSALSSGSERLTVAGTAVASTAWGCSSRTAHATPRIRNGELLLLERHAAGLETGGGGGGVTGVSPATASCAEAAGRVCPSGSTAQSHSGGGSSAHPQTATHARSCAPPSIARRPCSAPATSPSIARRVAARSSAPRRAGREPGGPLNGARDRTAPHEQATQATRARAAAKAATSPTGKPVLCVSQPPPTATVSRCRAGSSDSSPLAKRSSGSICQSLEVDWTSGWSTSSMRSNGAAGPALSLALAESTAWERSKAARVATQSISP
eukprot:scaffold25923_cov105-Isochrysis_galbana.AAC.6